MRTEPLRDRLAGGPVTLDLRAPAKINLALAVGSRRADGYHDLVSVLQTLDLYDELRVEVRLPDHDHPAGTVVFAPALLAAGGDTLVTRAGNSWIAATGIELAIRVRLRKRIPMGAGLGGGSSDAGVLLAALEELAGAPLGDERIATLAAQIGSDVPCFALAADRGAVVSGRGEFVQPLDDLPAATWLLAWPGVHQSTAAVYEEYRPMRQTLPAPHELVDQVKHERLRRNDLQEAAIAACPELARLVATASDLGAAPLVCGSGSTMAVELAFEEAGDVLVQTIARELTTMPGSVLEVATAITASSSAPVR